MNLKKGIVIRSTGSWYEVKTEDDGVVACRIKGKFKIAGLLTTNPIAVGDLVEFEQEAGLDTGMIKIIAPRKNYVVRQSPRKKHEVHLLAANVDQAIVIMTIVEPKLKQGFIDRFLLMTEPYNIPTTIVFNKSDLYDDDAMVMYLFMKEIYEQIGYSIMLVSAETGDKLDDLRAVLKDKTSLISGQSGVGKSSIVNALLPDLDLSTMELSDYSGKGQHTTTFAEMFTLPNGGNIIDTPGIKTLSFNFFEPMDVAHNFREFFAVSDQCKFGGSCMHKQEPGCAVKALVESEELSDLRYYNYLQLLEEVEEQNYWERKKRF